MITIKQATKEKEVMPIVDVKTLCNYAERRIENKLAFVGRLIDSSKGTRLYLINRYGVVDARDPWNVYSTLTDEFEFEVYEWVSVEMRYSID